MKTIFLLCLTSIAGCTGETFVIEPGFIQYGSQSISHNTPASVNLDQAFDLTIMTYGDGCVSFDSTEVVYAGNTATISPLDRRELEGACTSILQSFPHTAEIRFDTAGPKTIQFIGRTKSFGGTPMNIVEEVSVLVQ